jgi:hypothetical protein
LKLQTQADSQILLKNSARKFEKILIRIFPLLSNWPCSNADRRGATDRSPKNDAASPDKATEKISEKL